MSPLPKTPAYGDAAKLQQQSTGLKKTNGTYGPVIQRTPAGRPTGTGGTPAPRASQPQQPETVISPEHEQAYSSAANAELARQFWTMMAQRYPGPRTAYYLAQSELLAQRTMGKTYKATPDFEY